MHSLLPTVLLLSAITIAQADVYKCPDGTGKTVYQNHPCNDQAVPHLTTPTLSTPPPAPQAQEPPPPPAIVSPAAVSGPLAPPSDASPAESRPVDTRQLSLLQLGMGKAEVKRRLGPPASIDTSEVEGNGGFGRNVRMQVERWNYPGNSTAPAAVVVFKNGLLDSRGGEGQENRRSVGDVIFRR